MSVFNSDPCSCEARQTVPQGVPSEGSPQGVMEGRSETCRVSDSRRLTFFEAEQMAKNQVGVTMLYLKPKDYDRARMREYCERMELAAALCMTIAEVFTMGDGRLIRVDGEEIEAETVKEVFGRLRGKHVCKVIDAIRMEKDAEKKKAKLNRRYFRAALYNAVFEIPGQEQAGADRPTDDWT